MTFQAATQESNAQHISRYEKKNKTCDDYYSERLRSRSPAAAYRVYSRTLGFREYRVNSETYGETGVPYNCGVETARLIRCGGPLGPEVIARVSVLLIQLHYESPPRVAVA